jgi:hypothetical protein
MLNITILLNICINVKTDKEEYLELATKKLF